MKIVVTGIPGVGKTTILERAIAKSEKKYIYVNYGDIMFEEAKSMGIVKDRDEIRKLDPSIQKEIQKKAAKKIGKMENVIIDTHASILTPEGYLPGLPEWVLKEIMPNIIVIFEATPEEISRRRAKDMSRKRDVDDVGSIKEHQEMNRAIAMAYGALTGATIKIIQNHDDGLEEAIKNFEKIL